MLACFGDVHLSALNPWNIEVGEKFIQWFEYWAQTQKEITDLIWLGDITERDVNPGDVIDQEYRLFAICSKYFKSTYVVMGNHDLKLYRQKAQHSLKFLNNFENVYVIEAPEVYTICGTKVRFLPYMRIEGQSLNTYYSEMTFDEDVDLTVGHWNKVDKNNFIYRFGVDTSNMRTKMLCLGHIHKRIDPDYTGSIFPNKSDEGGERVYKVFNNGELVKEVQLPEFIRYEKIKYPNEIKKCDIDVVRVFTVTGIRNKTAAENFYQGYHIQGVVAQEAKSENTIESSGIFLYVNNKQAFQEWLKETKYPLSRRAYGVIDQLL